MKTEKTLYQFSFIPKGIKYFVPRDKVAGFLVPCPCAMYGRGAVGTKNHRYATSRTCARA